MHFFTILLPNNCVCDMYGRNFTAKMLQYTLSSGVEPTFVKYDFRFLSALVKCLLESNLASGVKPSIKVEYKD